MSDRINIFEFLSYEEYIKIKTEIEKTWFKCDGDYWCHKGDELKCLSSNKFRENYKGLHVNMKGIKPIEFYKLWSQDPKIRMYDNITFETDIKKVSSATYNLFNGFGQEFTETEKVDKMTNSELINFLEPIFEHVRTLCGYNTEAYTYHLNFLSHLIQQPHELPHSTQIFISDEGVGKDSYADFLGSIIGEKYYLNTIDIDKITGKFNSILGGKMLVVINETDPRETRDRVEKIKGLITQKTVLIEPKGKDPIKQAHSTRYIWFSNRLTAFPTSATSRRPIIMRSSSKYIQLDEEEKSKYFSKLRGYFNDKLYRYGFYKYLKNNDIRNFDFQKKIRTEFQADLDKLGAPPMANFLQQIIENQLTEMESYQSQHLFNKYTEFLKTNNYKFEIDNKKFTFELKNNYNVESYKSSVIKFRIIKSDIAKILKDKWKIEITEKNPEEQEEDNDDPENFNFDKLKNKIMMQDKLLTEKDKKIEEMEQQINELMKMMMMMQKKEQPEEQPKKIKNEEQPPKITLESINEIKANMKIVKNMIKDMKTFVKTKTEEFEEVKNKKKTISIDKCLKYLDL
jgi:hypothetical protein